MSTQLINRTERLASIEKLLFNAGAGLRVVEIAETCGVDRRTIYRDMALLEQIGVPIYQKDGRYFLNHDYYGASVRLNINELVALYIAARGLAYYVEQQNPHIISAVKKICKNLPPALAEHVQYMIDTVRTNPVDRAFVVVLETMTRAWAEKRKVKLWYRNGSDGTISIREFSIYFIEPASNGGLYAVGYDYLTHRVGAVRLQWVKRVQLLTGKYEVPSQWDRRHYLAGAWGIIRSSVNGPAQEVVLAFAPEVTPQVQERMRHTVQSFRINTDSRCVVQMQVADWREMLPWIRSWGTSVEVLEPKALRDEIAAEAARLVTVYQGVAS